MWRAAGRGGESTGVGSARNRRDLMAAPGGSLTLRPMTSLDIATAAVFSREQAWPHREEDWALFLEAGEGIVAERAGRLLGTVMAWRYGEDFATVGMVIVASDG